MRRVPKTHGRWSRWFLPIRIESKDSRSFRDAKLESAEKMWAVLPSGSVGNHSHEPRWEGGNAEGRGPGVTSPPGQPIITPAEGIT